MEGEPEYDMPVANDMPVAQEDAEEKKATEESRNMISNRPSDKSDGHQTGAAREYVDELMERASSAGQIETQKESMIPTENEDQPV